MQSKSYHISRETSSETQFTAFDEVESYYYKMFAKIIVKLLQESVPGANQVVSFDNVMQFLNFLRQKVNLLIHEGLIAIQLLKKFINKQQQKKMQVLSEKNSGTIILVIFIVTFKFYRDKVPKNSYFSDEFKIPLNVLNHSEASFLRMMDHELFVECNFSSLLVQDDFKLAIESSES